MESIILALIPVIVNEGIPAAEKLWQMYASKSVTQADWDQLKTLAAQNASSIFAERLQAAGIPSDSPQGKILLGLTA